MSVGVKRQYETFRSSPLRFQLLFVASCAMIPVGFVLAVLGGPQSSILIYIGIYLSIALLLTVATGTWMIIQIWGDSE